MNTKNKKGTHLKKKVARKIRKKKLHAKLQKSYKNIMNTLEQEQDEKVTRASIIHHAMCLKIKKT
jgi:hypothetical protein